MDRRDLEGNLGPLREMGEYDVAPHEPDPRGWQVLSSDGTQIGNVDDLIVDTKDMKVHYLDCDLDESRLNLSGGDRDRHILVPVENASLNESDRKVRVHGMNADDVLALPAYMGGALTPGIASRVSQFFGSRGSTARETTDRTTTDRTMKGTGRDENIGRDFDEQRLTRSEEEMAVGKRMVDAGEIRIHKTVETEHVTRPVTRHHEEVDVERNGLGRIERTMPEWLRGDLAVVAEPSNAVIEAGCQGTIRVELRGTGKRAQPVDPRDQEPGPVRMAA
jgi:hypothetical protein